MEDIKAQLSSLLKRPQAKPSLFALNNDFLQSPKVVAAVLGLLLILSIVFCESLNPSRALISVATGGSKTTRRGGPATALLVGPVDGGKTSLFAKIVHDSYPQTHTSISPSSTTFPLTEPDGEATKSLTLVDLPGHPRLKDEFKKNVKGADAVVFVVDIVGLVRTAGSVAEQLPPILSALANLANQTGRIPRLLILAHKTDLLVRPTPPARTSPPDIPAQTRQVAIERLKSILTREMDRLKAARTAGVGGRIEGMSKVSSGGRGWFGKLFASAEVEGEVEEDEGLVWGGKGPFRWEDIDGVEIEWASSALGMVNMAGTPAAKDGEQGNGLDELRTFLWDL